MRKGLLSLLALSGLHVACPSSDTNDPPVPTPSPTPVLAASWFVDPVALSFPVTAIGEIREASITVRNTGDAPLNIEASDGPITSPTISFDPGTAPLAKGEATVIIVRYAPTGAGPHTAVVRVNAGVGALAPIAVTVSGTTPGQTVEVSTAAVDFGAVVIGNVGRAEVTLSNPTNEVLEVTTATATNATSCDHPAVADSAFCYSSRTQPVGADGRITLEARASLTLELVFRPTVAGLRARGELSFRTCVGPRCPAATHSVALQGLGVASSIHCDVDTVDFGRVGTVACADRQLRCENASTVQRGLVSIALDVTRTSTSFTLPTAPTLIELGAHDSTTIELRYCPGGSGADEGVLVIETDDPDPRQRSIEVALVGTGGGPDLEVAPTALAFGSSVVGAPARRALRLMNLGDEDLEISAIDAPPEVTFVGDLTTPIPGGETRTVAVDLVLNAATAFTGALTIHSNDPAEPRISVDLQGQGVALQPCVYEVVPSALELGVVELSRSVSRAVEVRNVGSTDCLLSAARLLPGTEAGFALVDDPRGLSIAPGASRVVGVTFAPLTSGARTGTLELSLSSPTAPLATIPITASGDELSLLISPHEINFGVVDLGCRSRGRAVAIYNTGVTPLYVSDVRMAEPANPVFTLDGLPALTATVAPSNFVEFEVGFQAAGNAEYAGAIEVITGTGAAALTHIIGLRGQGDMGGIQVDNFRQLGEPQVDILWVIDDSGSMAQEQASLADNFLSFVRFADAQGLDYHMSITTTDVAGGERGRFVPLSGSGTRIVTPLTQPSPVTVFTQNARVGTGGSGNEQGIEASYLALSNPLIGTHNAGFLRPEAALSVIYVSDEEDSSTARTLDFFVSFLLGIKGAQNANTFTASAIVGNAPSGCSGSGGSASAGNRYIEIAERTGGIFQSICTPDWARALENVSTTAFGFKSRFVLGGQPVEPTIAVTVDGAGVPPVDAQGAQRWSYDAGANAVVFTPYATPEPGSQIRVEYRAECL